MRIFNVYGKGEKIKRKLLSSLNKAIKLKKALPSTLVIKKRFHRDWKSY